MAEQEKRGVAQQVFGQWNKYCNIKERCLPRKFTVLGITYILLLSTSALPRYIFLSETHLISLMVTMTQNLKGESDNLGKYHYLIAPFMMTLRKMYWGNMSIFMGLTIMRMLPASLTRHKLMRLKGHR